MVSIEEAQATILSQILPLGAETVPLLQAIGRITTEDHVAELDIPPADNSAMDGYAFSHASLAGDTLLVDGFVPAGTVHDAPVPPGHAVKIMTGAPVPAGCDTVVPVEDVEASEGSIRITGRIRQGCHVRSRGEDIRRGDLIIPSGTLLRPQETGILASLGKTAVSVYRRARVAVLSTGDELVEPGAPLQPGKIVNSNSYSIAAQVIDSGAEPVLLGIARDCLEETCAKIRQGLDADFMIITGGVSVGDRDFVREGIEKLGGSMSLWKVNMKPGKPVAFARLQGKPVFALPGNPAAAMVSFEFFVRPSILKAMGHRRVYRSAVKAVLDEATENRGSRPHMVRGTLSMRENRYYVSTTGNQSSGRLTSFIEANSLIRLPPDASHRRGDEVEVLMLDRSVGMGETL